MIVLLCKCGKLLTPQDLAAYGKCESCYIARYEPTWFRSQTPRPFPDAREQTNPCDQLPNEMKS